ncbi:MAG: hypothetical protein ACLQO1_04995 [Steroidobacteraceae bacterium]
MTNTDSTPFMDLVPAISVRENERKKRQISVAIRERRLPALSPQPHCGGFFHIFRGTVMVLAAQRRFD